MSSIGQSLPNREINQKPPSFCNTPWLKVQLWAAHHPLAIKVIAACMGLFLTGMMCLGLLCGGAPLWAVITFTSLVGTISLCPAWEGPPIFRTVEQICSRNWTGSDETGLGTIGNLRIDLEVLGSDRFKEKFQTEIQIWLFPCSLVQYKHICESLEKAEADDEFYGPLPKIKSDFIEKLKEPDSQKYLADKKLVAYLTRSQILSNEEGR